VLRVAMRHARGITALPVRAEPAKPRKRRKANESKPSSRGALRRGDPVTHDRIGIASPRRLAMTPVLFVERVAMRHARSITGLPARAEGRDATRSKHEGPFHRLRHPGPRTCAK